jgi:hypothetical protein
MNVGYLQRIQCDADLMNPGDSCRDTSIRNGQPNYDDIFSQSLRIAVSS